MENIFQTNFAETVLIVYLEKKSYSAGYFGNGHPNHQRARVVSKIFHEFGFNVDVVGDLFTGKIDYSKYSIIFGNGIPYEKSFSYDLNTLRIYFPGGAHLCQRNVAELKRLSELKKRRNVILQPKRIKQYSEWLSISMSDAIFCIGNSWTKSTYTEYYDGFICNIPANIYSYHSYNDITRNWDEARYNFIWLGGAGFVLKGLDICIESFRKLPRFNLHICGRAESDFFNIYEQELDGCKNIHYHGFYDISGQAFKDLVQKCGFVIYPGASEGQSTGVLSAMYSGLVPIVTRETGIDIAEGVFEIDFPHIKNITSIVKTVSKATADDLEKWSKAAFIKVNSDNTLDQFTLTFKEHFNDFWLSRI